MPCCRAIFATILSVIAVGANLYGGTPHFTENKGQWNSAVHFRAETRAGYVYLDRDGLTIDMLEDGFFNKLHDHIKGEAGNSIGRAHALKLVFEGADLSTYEATDDAGTRKNYYLGNDPSRWAPNTRSFFHVVYSAVYPGIDLRYNSSSENLKYEFIVAPGSSVTPIKTRIEGADDISIRNGDLVIRTSVGEYRELKPFAYQIDLNGRLEPVPCQYILENGTVTYGFPEGYDENLELVIDPQIAFSSYVGSISDNFGFTASYDHDGNLYAGAIVFGASYPVTAGAYEIDFNGGNIDCGITKFNSEGTDLLYSTFYGGFSAESPHSLVVNDDNELYVLGSTSSNDLPGFQNSFQSNFHGGTFVNGIGFSYDSGSDIFVAKFNSDGTQLLSSTYLGGSGNDGVGQSPILDFNYGDIFRGEIVLDDASNVYIASVTGSDDFPLVGGFSSDIAGQSTGVVCKLDPGLTTMIWSTFTGGTADNAVYGLQLGPDNSIYVTGGTRLGVMPGTDNGAQSAHGGGSADGFIQRIAPDGSSVMGATFCGTNLFDQNYFVQLDTDGNVYVIGQSLGQMPISDGVYANPGSKQFIQKYSPDLGELLWSTQVGSGSNEIDISPSAFLVTNCNQIYLSGWGGSVNDFGDAGGNTFGLPITDDAFQSGTDGSDFYLMVLDADAAGLVYATYFGGSLSAEHVDGGTSRFDKNGTVYQAVCAGCGGNSDFPTQPGVWSQTNDAFNCNLGVFKFKLASVTADADIDAPNLICTGDEVNFVNTSTGADTYFWNFGDGEESSLEEPTHTYSQPGTYEVQLYAEDSQGCLAPDSTILTITIEGSPEVEVEEPDALCPGESIILHASGADEFIWSPADGLSNPAIANPVFTGDETITYTVSGSTICGVDEVEVTVEVGVLEIDVETDIELCPGESFTFNASGGTIYAWSPDTYLDDADIPNPTTTPETDINYQLDVETDLGCAGSVSIHVNLLPPPPVLSGDTFYVACNGNPVQLFTWGGDNYSWMPAAGLSDPEIANPTAGPSATTTYTVTSVNECGSGTLNVLVKTSEVDISLLTDSMVCHDEPFFVQAAGGETYRWQPPEKFADAHAPSTSAVISGNTRIKVIGYNADGCHETESAFVRIYPRAIVNAGPDHIISYGEEVELRPYSIYPITWEESPYLSCTECMNPIASPLDSWWFHAFIISPDGCSETDSVLVTVRGNIYVPNAFTPDGDGLNDIFKAKGVDITLFKIEIYDRWGELVFESDDIEQGWNGHSKNEEYFAPSGMYPYRIVAREHGGDVFELSGQVYLLR